MKKLFEIKESVIYAQEGIVDIRSVARTPAGIYYQHEARPAVQSILELYCSSYFTSQGWAGCSYVIAFSISNIENELQFRKETRETFKEVLEEAKTRGYIPPFTNQFDAVLTAIYKKENSGTPPFDLDRALGEFYLQRYDPQKQL